MATRATQKCASPVVCQCVSVKTREMIKKTTARGHPAPQSAHKTLFVRGGTKLRLNNVTSSKRATEVPLGQNLPHPGPTTKVVSLTPRVAHTAARRRSLFASKRFVGGPESIFFAYFCPQRRAFEPPCGGWRCRVWGDWGSRIGCGRAGTDSISQGLVNTVCRLAETSVLTRRTSCDCAWCRFKRCRLDS